MRLTAWVTGAVIVLSAAARPAGEQERPPRDAVIAALADDTSTVAPDFAADVLIRLSGSPKVADPAWRRELLEDAFFRAYGAQEQYRRTATQPVSPDSRQGANFLASTTALTRVSLQVRATQLMAVVDPGRARELFEWIELNLDPGSCEDLLVPDVEEYYSALSLLARTTFGGDHREALYFFELYLWRAHLPSEMPAVARALQRFHPQPDEAVYLEGLLRWLLDGGSSDARGFSTSSLDLVSRIADLQAADHALGTANWFLLDTLRIYLATQLAGSRCSDSMVEPMVPPAFNAAVARIGAAKDVKLLDAAAVAPSKIMGVARVDPYWQTPDSLALHNAAGRLWGSGKAPAALRVRQTPDWRAQAERLLNDLDQWDGRREASDRDYFYQKAAIFTILLDLVPPGALRVRTIRTYADFLRRADLDRDRRTLWFAFLTRLLEMARAADRREILSALEDTHHPVLSLYARLERVQPQARLQP